MKPPKINAVDVSTKELRDAVRDTQRDYLGAVRLGVTKAALQRAVVLMALRHLLKDRAASP